MDKLATANTAKHRNTTILVVEDNADQWFIIRWALQQRFPEVDAIWMSDAHQTMHYLDACTQDMRELPRLILLDLYLPQREIGWSLLQFIKTHHLYRELPVIVLSQSADIEDIKESYFYRGNSYIVKPSGYEKWLECFTYFRHYWWDAVTLPKFTE
ncbi:response regulator [Spirosoma endophyticum]|uniref:Response regulator receiver domain-containing protein n=1 Tax=Spirosoma endophyticum TaxID=662367 RepID=A0A1I1N4M3_9BACT|nr:response regulator [Spirosoma endophyticum]SFC88740.1 Response regulator receiver domain-containing protein [Spirosoma endophyticum]